MDDSEVSRIGSLSMMSEQDEVPVAMAVATAMVLKMLARRLLFSVCIKLYIELFKWSVYF